jgi:hypothetical protein
MKKEDKMILNKRVILSGKINFTYFFEHLKRVFLYVKQCFLKAKAKPNEFP